MKRVIVASAAALAACSTVSDNPETYQRALITLCTAPPSIMREVLTTDQLKTSWAFICAHTHGVPATPVPSMNIAEP